MSQQTQQKLLDIVQTWNPSPSVEYRRFRCANCQMHIAGPVYHHLLTAGGFICPVHLCRECQSEFNANVLVPKNPKIEVDKIHFSIIPNEAKKLMESWNMEQTTPILKEIICDECSQLLEKDDEGYPQGYHIWWKTDSEILVEIHLDKNCAENYSIKS